MGKLFRLIVVLLTLAIGIWFIYPTIRWYFFTSPVQKKEAQIPQSQLYKLVNAKATAQVQKWEKRINAGVNDLLPEDKIYLSLAEKELKRRNLPIPKKWTLTDFLGAFPNENSLKQSLMELYKDKVVYEKSLRKGIIQLGLDLSGGLYASLHVDYPQTVNGHKITGQDKTILMNQLIQVINARLDMFGVSEPQINAEPNSGRIFIDLPGVPDADRLNLILQGAGDLKFQLVDEKKSAILQTKTETAKENYIKNLPKNEAVFFSYTKNDYGLLVPTKEFVLYTDPVHTVSGTMISKVQASQDNITQQPTVNFTLNAKGTKEFYQLTKNNVNKPLAIVLQNQIRAMPNISGPIEQGNVQVSGFNGQEARELSIVLKAGSVPLNLKLDNVSIVGPSLAHNAIHYGLLGVLIGLICIFLVMLFYYQLAGLIAVIVILINLFLTLSLLSAADFTLTLTGLAGLILSMGMAVDANVIIYERIKEEYFLGHRSYSAVHKGFSQSFWTIMDSNVTTLIASMLISFFGSGPIKGFAFTLSWGLIISLYTSLFVSHFLFDVYNSWARGRSIPISWRKLQ